MIKSIRLAKLYADQISEVIHSYLKKYLHFKLIFVGLKKEGIKRKCQTELSLAFLENILNIISSKLTHRSYSEHNLFFNKG